MITEKKAIEKIVHLLKENKKRRAVPISKPVTFLSALKNAEKNLKKDVCSLTKK